MNHQSTAYYYLTNYTGYLRLASLCLYNQSEIKLLTELMVPWCMLCQLTRESVMCVPFICVHFTR